MKTGSSGSLWIVSPRFLENSDIQVNIVSQKSHIKSFDPGEVGDIFALLHCSLSTSHIGHVKLSSDELHLVR